METQAKQEPSFKISPEEYQKILQGVEILGVSLASLKYNCKVGIEVKNITMSLNTSSALKSQQGNTGVIGYNFDFKGNFNKAVVLRAEGQYDIKFSSTDILTADFLEIFQPITLDSLIWPYLRELFSDMTVKTGLPAFVLPLLKFIPHDKKNRM